MDFTLLLSAHFHLPPAVQDEGKTKNFTGREKALYNALFISWTFKELMLCIICRLHLTSGWKHPVLHLMLNCNFSL